MSNILKTTLLFFAVIFVSKSTYAQRFHTVKGNGKMSEIYRNVGSFDGISVSGSFDVKLIYGKEGLIKIKAEENLIGLIETEVVGNTLKIKWRKNTSISTRRNIYITVNIAKIKEVRVTGASDVVAEGTITGKNLKLSVSGSGSIDMHVDTKNLNAVVTGSGDIDIQGKTEFLKASVTGSGDLKAKKLTSPKVEARVTGSGDMEITVTGELIARVSGSGDIHYHGNPSIEDINVSGSGEVSTF